MSISLSKCPMLETIAWCFIFAMCAAVMMSKLPVAVTKMSAWPTTSSSVVTWKPPGLDGRPAVGVVREDEGDPRLAARVGPRLLHVVQEDADLARVVDAAGKVVGGLARVREVPGVGAGEVISSLVMYGRRASVSGVP